MSALGAAPAPTPEVAPSRLHRAAVVLVTAGLLANTLAGNSWRLGLPVPPDRLLLAAGVLALCLDGTAWRAARPRWRPVHGLMVAMTAWTLWSALVHGSLLSSYGGFALLDRVVLPYGFFVLAPVLFRSERDRSVLLRALVGLGLYLGTTAVLEVLGPHALVWPRYIMDPDAGILFGRARGPFVEAEADGLVLAACLFASGLATTRLSGGWRVAAQLAVPLTALGTVLCLTRSIWLGVLLGLLLVVRQVPSLRRRLPAAAGGAVVVLVAVLVAVPAAGDALVDRLTTERSVYDRQNTNAAALRIVRAHPLTGIGWMQYLDQSVDWVRQADSYPITNVTIEVHNVVLSRAAELGVPGAALWVGSVLAGPGVAAARRRRGGPREGWRLVLVGYGGVWAVCTMVSPLPYPLANNLLWLLAGLTMPTADEPRVPAERPGDRRRDDSPDRVTEGHRP